MLLGLGAHSFNIYTLAEFAVISVNVNTQMLA